MSTNSTEPRRAAHYPHGGTYADHLCWHMDYWGTRPASVDGFNGEPRKSKEFLEAAFGTHWDDDSPRVGLANWRGRGAAPDSINAKRIEDALFGNSQIFEVWRADLESARVRSRGRANNTRTKSFPSPPPQGLLTWAGDSFGVVPLPTPVFHGRKDDLEIILRAIDATTACRPILVSGGPGIGKTELTKALAHSAFASDRYGTRRWFVSLENASNAEEMTVELLRVFGNGATTLGECLERISGSHSLLVLDNLETPWEPIAGRETTEALLSQLASTDKLQIIASLRGNEWVGGPDWQTHLVGELSHDAGKEILASIAGEWIRLDEDLGRVIELTGGLPLALRLMARRAYGCSRLRPILEESLRIGSDLLDPPRLSRSQ